MQSRKTQQAAAKKLLKQLNILDLDASSVIGQTPMYQLTEYQKMLETTEKQEADQRQNSTTTSPQFHSKLENLINECRKKISQISAFLGTHAASSIKKAKFLVSQHASKLSHIISFHQTNSHVSRPYGATSFGTSIFNRSTNAQFHTWNKLQDRLSDFHSIARQNPHNALTLLLTTNNDAFLTAVDNATLPIGGEIGHLVVQRLRSIAANSKAERQHKRKANTLLKMALSGVKDSLLNCDPDALETEITKLALHASRHPDKKVFWIGTARAVNSMLEKHPGDAAYFNPAQEFHTWELNRAVLQAAVNLGYEIKLVEQHYPNIEKGILSNDPALFLETLASEVRPADKTSQYSGDNAPTATTQEVLVLMDLGCKARKNPDNSISFYSVTIPKEEPAKPVQRAPALLRRTHSCPDLFAASAPPPLTHLSEHFTAPTTGPAYLSNCQR